MIAAGALALLAAILFAVGSCTQHLAAAEVPDEEAEGLGLLARLIRRPLWLAGTAADLLGFIAQMAALAFGSLLLIQPLLATTLLFALPAAARLSHRRLSRSDWRWALLLTGGLAVFLATGHLNQGHDQGSLRRWLLMAVVLVPLVVAMWAAGAPRRGAARAVPFAMAAGILFGTTSALAKPTVSLLGSGLLDVLGAWEPYAMVACGALGILLQQAAYQTGALALSLPAITVLEPITASALGVVVLGEEVRASGAGWLVIGASCAAMAGGVVALSRAEAALERRPPAGAAPASAGGTVRR
jgi:hypothetical protein